MTNKQQSVGELRNVVAIQEIYLCPSLDQNDLDQATTSGQNNIGWPEVVAWPQIILTQKRMHK